MLHRAWTATTIDPVNRECNIFYLGTLSRTSSSCGFSQPYGHSGRPCYTHSSSSLDHDENGLASSLSQERLFTFPSDQARDLYDLTRGKCDGASCAVGGLQAAASPFRRNSPTPKQVRSASMARMGDGCQHIVPGFFGAG
jgi:hypothetical protein